jgi:hypothetical protein
MRFIRISLIVCTFGVMACGSSPEQQGSEAQAPESKAAPHAPSSGASKPAAEVELPKMLIARVPVDAQGNELNDQAETREIMVTENVVDAATAEQTFANSQGQTIVIDNELDQDSSSEQCWNCGRRRAYWGTPWYPGKLLGRGLWWGRNPYFYYGGYAYGYRNIGCYYGGGYNYYPYTYVNPVGPVGGPGAGVGYVNPVGPAGGPGAGAGYIGGF